MLAVIVPAIGTRGFITVIIWSGEALALVAMGVKWQRRYFWEPAIAIYVLAASLLALTQNAFYYQSPGAFVPLMNERALATIALSTSLVGCTVLLKRLKEGHAKDIRQVLVYAACAIGFALLTVEANDVFRRMMLNANGQDFVRLGYGRFLTVALVWLAMAGPCCTLDCYENQGSRVSGLLAGTFSVCLAAMAAVTYQPIETFSPVLNVRAWFLIAVIGAWCPPRDPYAATLRPTPGLNDGYGEFRPPRCSRLRAHYRRGE